MTLPDARNPPPGLNGTIAYANYARKTTCTRWACRNHGRTLTGHVCAVFQPDLHPRLAESQLRVGPKPTATVQKNVPLTMQLNVEQSKPFDLELLTDHINQGT